MSGVYKDPSSSEMNSSQHRKCLFTFLLTGAFALYYWNAVLNALYSVVLVRYEGTTWLGDTFTASYSTVAFLTSLLLSYKGALKRSYNLIGSIVLGIMCLLFPVIATQVDGSLGITLLIISACVAGFATMLVQVSGFAFGVILPRQYGGWISLGYGACGILTFAFWMLFSQAIFSVETTGGIQGALWCHFGIAALLSVPSAYFFWTLTGDPLVQNALERIQNPNVGPAVEDLAARSEEGLLSSTSLDPAAVVGDESEAASPYWTVFKKTWLMQVGLAFLIGLSMMAYPNIGPYGWNRSIKENDILTGVFQIGDFLGRYIPNVAGVLLFGRKTVTSLNALRVVILVLFIVIKYIHSDSILHAYGVQVLLMACLSLSNGWYASIYMCRVSETVDKGADKARASSMAVSLLVFAIAAGLWLAKLA